MYYLYQDGELIAGSICKKVLEEKVKRENSKWIGWGLEKGFGCILYTGTTPPKFEIKQTT